MTEDGPMTIFRLTRSDGRGYQGQREQYTVGPISTIPVELKGPVIRKALVVQCDGYRLRLAAANEQPLSFELMARRSDENEGTLEFINLPPEFARLSSTRFVLRRLSADAALPQLGERTAFAQFLQPGQGAEHSNRELASMFEEDQAIRHEMRRRGWSAAQEDQAFMRRFRDGDASRLARTRQILTEGTLHTGLDYWRAAFILQHGGQPNDYLQAHHLAVVSIALGYSAANWIAAATLDRYLQSIGRGQIYGTQYAVGAQGQQQAVAPFDEGLVTDIERAALSVPARQAAPAASSSSQPH